MKKETLELLCDPQDKSALTLQTSPEGTPLLCGGRERVYPCSDGFADFLAGSPLGGTNKRYQAMYNALAPFYNYVTRTAIYLMNTTEEEVRRQYLCELEIRTGDLVLEVSVGTGSNLCLLPRGTRYFGLDISPGQLLQCRKNLKRAGLEAELFLGQAECLPFRDNVFDVVFHMGGINFFNDPTQAVAEMVRVAKPGTKLVIVDETARFSGKLAKIPIVREFFKHEHGAESPASLVPAGVSDVAVREIFNGRLWCLTLRKAVTEREPAAATADSAGHSVLSGSGQPR